MGGRAKPRWVVMADNKIQSVCRAAYSKHAFFADPLGDTSSMYLLDDWVEICVSWLAVGNLLLSSVVQDLVKFAANKFVLHK